MSFSNSVPQLAGTYFTLGGRRRLVLGAHWIPARSALQWPLSWDAAEIEQDFRTMRELGYNTVRFDLFWAWFEPAPGAYREEAFRQFDVLLKEAARRELWLNPTFFVGGEVGEAFWDVPWRHGRHPHADPEMLRLQTDHVREFARRYRGHPQILAWDLTDEPPFWIAKKQTTDAMAVNWTRLLAGMLRRYDPEHLIVVGTDRADLSHGPFRPDVIVDEVDFLSVHPYPIYDPVLFPDPMLSERGGYAAAFQTLLSAGAGKPVMVQELGASSAQYDPERIAACDRVGCYSSLGVGSNGFVLWCHTDAAPATYARAPYRRAAHETQFGLTHADGRDRPRGAFFRQFARQMEALELEQVEPAPPDAGLLVPWEWAKRHGDASRFGLTEFQAIPYSSTQDGGQLADVPLPNLNEPITVLTGAWLSGFILARRAGLSVRFVREHHDWQSLQMLFLPWPLAGTSSNVQHVQTDFWREVRAWVEQGGVLYTSLSADAAIPEMAEWMGVRLADHRSTATIEVRFERAFGEIAAGETVSWHGQGGKFGHWPALLDRAGGEVLARDAEGSPAVVHHACGRGHVVTTSFPLESWLAGVPNAFEGASTEHRLYAAVAALTGRPRTIATNHPSVEASLLSGKAHAYAVLTNHRAEPRPVTVTTAMRFARATHLDRRGGSQEIATAGNRFEITVPGHDGAIVRLEGVP